MSEAAAVCTLCSSTRLRQHCGRFSRRRGWVRCVDCSAFGDPDGRMVPAAATLRSEENP